MQLGPDYRVMGIGVFLIVHEVFGVGFAVGSSYATPSSEYESCSLVILARNNDT